MPIKILEQSADKLELKLLIEGYSKEFVNSLRRIILSEVPTLAINDVWVVKNSSPLYDEIIAHRLGLIPLVTDLETYVLPEECDCKGNGCASCSVAFTLEKQAEEDNVIVYSDDLTSEDEKIKAVSRIPIVQLSRNQSVVLEAYARLGRGKDHAKWQPVGTCTYKYMPIIHLRNDLCEYCKECVNQCPRHILEYTKEPFQSIVIKDTENCTMCKVCEEVCEYGAINVSWNDEIFIFTIESTGALSALEILKTAIKILKEKFDTLKIKINELVD